MLDEWEIHKWNSVFGWQENGKNIYIQKIKALKPRLDFFFFGGIWKFKRFPQTCYAEVFRYNWAEGLKFLSYVF